MLQHDNKERIGQRLVRANMAGVKKVDKRVIGLAAIQLAVPDLMVAQRMEAAGWKKA